MEKDIRWKQRYENYVNALKNLEEGVRLKKERSLSKLEEQGVIQAFEFTFELAWNLIKDFLESNLVDAKYPRDVIKAGFQNDIIDDGDVWICLKKRI